MMEHESGYKRQKRARLLRSIQMEHERPVEHDPNLVDAAS
jgi:hypothetical protein